MAKIMLVEDDRSLQEIYSIRLVAEGYDIAKADDGEEALAKAVQEKPDLIIADVMMPKISGFDMLDILRSQPETQNIKVIMMTALSSDDQRQRGEALGAERYLVKSQVGIEDVINAVHEVLGDKPNDSAKSNIDTLSNVPKQQENSASEVPQAPSVAASASLEGVQTTATTTIQPTNPAAGPIPGGPVPGGQIPNSQEEAMPSNFNQAPAAMAVPGTVPIAQPMGTPATGAFTVPAAQMTGGMSTIVPPAQQVIPNAPVPGAVPGGLPVPPVQASGTALQTTDRILPNAQLSAAIQAAEAAERMREDTAQTEEQKPNGGERVIQPIHDPRMDNMRNEMQQRMAEILGDDANASGPQEINTKTARKVAQAQATPAPAQEAAQAPGAGLPPQIEQNPVEQAKGVKLPPDTTSQQDLVRNQLATQPVQEVDEAVEPTTVAEAQAIQAETQKVAAAEQAEQETATNAVAPQAPQTQQAPGSSINLGEDEPTVEAIQPGYISQLEDDLSEDVNKVTDNDMAARMANELKDDEITKEAQTKAEAAAIEAAKEAERDSTAMAANHSEEIEHALESVAAEVSPNMSTPTEQIEPQPAPAPQSQPAPEPQPVPQAPAEPLPRPVQGPAPQTLAPEQVVRSTSEEVSGNIPH